MWLRVSLLAAPLACTGCTQKALPPPIVVSVPGPENGARVEIALPRLAALAPPSTEKLCADTKGGSAPAAADAAPSWEARRAAACNAPPTQALDAFIALTEAVQPTRDSRLAGAAGLVEALRRAPTLADARRGLRQLGVFLRDAGDRLGAPDIVAASAEAYERLTLLCAAAEPSCKEDHLVDAGKAFVESGRWHGDEAVLREAIGFLERARALVPATDRHELTVVVNEIGNAYGYLAELHEGPAKRDDLAASVDAYEHLRPVMDRSDHDFDWAMVHHNLGTAYDALSKSESQGDGAQHHLDKAIAEFEASLTVFTRTDHEDAWGAGTDNLGAAIFRRGQQRDNRADTARGLDILRTTLDWRAERKADEPLPWAYSAMHFAWHLIDRSDLDQASAPEQAQRDRSDAKALLDASEPVLRAAKAAHYLEHFPELRRRLAESSPSFPSPLAPR